MCHCVVLYPSPSSSHFACQSHFRPRQFVWSLYHLNALGALGDFGKHVPKASQEKSDNLFRSLFGDASGVEMEQAKKLMSELLPGDDIGEFPPPEGMDAFEDIFSEEFAKAAEVQMREAFELFSKENPDLLQQFEQLAPELVGDSKATSEPSGGEGTSSLSPPGRKEATSNTVPPCEAEAKQPPKQQSGASQGSPVTPTRGGEANGGVSGGKGPSSAEGGAAAPDLHSAVDEALKSMQENAENVGKVRPHGSGLQPHTHDTSREYHADTTSMKPVHCGSTASGCACVCAAVLLARLLCVVIVWHISHVHCIVCSLLFEQACCRRCAMCVPL